MLHKIPLRPHKSTRFENNLIQLKTKFKNNYFFVKKFIIEDCFILAGELCLFFGGEGRFLLEGDFNLLFGGDFDTALEGEDFSLADGSGFSSSDSLTNSYSFLVTERNHLFFISVEILSKISLY